MLLANSELALTVLPSLVLASVSCTCPCNFISFGCLFVPRTNSVFMNYHLPVL